MESQIADFNFGYVLSWVERSGVPFGILCVLSYVFLKCLWWIGEKVVVPIVSGHTGFLSEVRSSIAEIAESNHIIAEGMTNLIDISTANGIVLHNLTEANEEIIQTPVGKILPKRSKSSTIPRVESIVNEYSSTD